MPGLHYREPVDPLAGGLRLESKSRRSCPEQKVLNESTGKLYNDITSAVREAGSGESLHLVPGRFYISSALDVGLKHRQQRRQDGLILRGSGRDRTSIISSDMTNVFVSIEHARGVQVRDLVLTHASLERNICEYGVILLYNAQDFALETECHYSAGGHETAQTAYRETSFLATSYLGVCRIELSDVSARFESLPVSSSGAQPLISGFRILSCPIR